MDFISTVLSPLRDATSAFALGSSTALSGGCVREDGKGSYGFSLLRGKRMSMEDFHTAQYKKDPRTGQLYGLFGIFDVHRRHRMKNPGAVAQGHGGPHAADYVRSNLFVNMMHSNKFISDLPACVAEAYETTDNQYLRQESSSGREDGCTAVTAVVVGQRLLVANVGDSRAVLCRGGKAIALSVDHKPNVKEERSRIEGAGGVVVWAGTWRVGGVLAVSRAFGDRPLKRYVIPTPSVMEESLTSEDEFLMLASDGLWDVMTNQEAVTLIRDITDAEQAAKRVTEEAYHLGSNDNISCVVIRFRA